MLLGSTLLVFIVAGLAEAGDPKEPTKIEFKGWFSNPAFTADGKTLVYAQMAAIPYGARTGTTQVVVWNVAANKEARRFDGPADDSLIGPIALTPDGKRLALGLWNTAVRLLDVEGGKDLGRIEGSRGAQPLCFAPDGKTVAYLQNGEIHVADAATAKDLRHFGKEGDAPLGNVAFLDGKTVLTVSTKFTDVSPPGTGKNRTFKHEITYTAWDATAGTKIGQVGEMMTQTRKSLEGPPLYSIFVTQGGKKIILASDRGGIEVCDVSTRKKEREIAAPWKTQENDHVRRLAFSANGEVVAAVTARGVISVCDLNTGKELHRIETGQNIDHVALSPDAKTLAVTYQIGGQVGAVMLIYQL
jgi:WD40 repeat protein